MSSSTMDIGESALGESNTPEEVEGGGNKHN